MINTTNFELRFFFPIYIRWRPVRMMKHWWQRRTRGFDDSELWSLDTTITDFVAPRLRAFEKMKRCGYPPCYNDNWSEAKQMGKWEEELEIMARAFELMSIYNGDAYDFDLDKMERDQKTIEKGLRLFGKRYRNLWD